MIAVLVGEAAYVCRWHQLHKVRSTEGYCEPRGYEVEDKPAEDPSTLSRRGACPPRSAARRRSWRLAGCGLASG
jgi:hypothetical protein